MNTTFAVDESAGSDISRNSQPILIIEDDPMFLDVLIELLRLNGFRVQSTLSGHDGLYLSQSSQPVCILLDLKLADMDGYEVLRQLKNHAQTQPVPVIVVSGFARSDDRDRALAWGAAAYFSKPFQTQEFIETIHEVIGKRV
jgi:CheY-like chemotaxis protein